MKAIPGALILCLVLFACDTPEPASGGAVIDSMQLDPNLSKATIDTTVQQDSLRRY